MKKRKKFFIVLVTFLVIFSSNSLYTSAQEYALDTYSKSHAQVFSHTKNMVSINPTIAAESAPANVKTVSFSIRLTGAIQYDRITSKFIAVSSPVVELNYAGPVSLTLTSASTWYRDNGNSITFYYNCAIGGGITANSGIYCTMDYGTVNGSFTVKK